MEVVVIVPKVYNSINNTPSRWTIFPVEPASVATALKLSGHAVTGIDLNLLPQPTDAALEANIKAIQPDVAVFIPQWLGRYDMKAIDPTSFDTVQRAAPSCIRINTGVQATLYPGMELNSGVSFEYGLRGEVEDTLVALLNTIAIGGNVKAIPGLFYASGDTHFISDKIPSFDLSRMEAVDELIFPRRNYLHRLERGNFRYPRDGQPLTYTQTSRGCHYKCRFCSVIYLRNYSFRQKRLDVIFSEIENGIAAGAKEIHFLDELFGRNREFLLQFCTEIERRGLKFNWFATCGLPLGYLDLELLKRLEKSGMYRVKIPFESASPRVLNKLLKKPNTVSQGWEVARAVKQTGLESIAAFLVGMPGESKEEMAQTVAMAHDIDFDYTLFSIATPMGGSQLESEVLEQGLASRQEIREKIRGDSVFFETDELKERDLFEVRWKIWSDINFASRAKTRKIAKMFGISENEAASMGLVARQRFQQYDTI
ncbi:MAG: radical SAM protein [Magnetococcales bacterium]|nr:radical SAM protein [Magnetococcales bacterium]